MWILYKALIALFLCYGYHDIIVFVAMVTAACGGEIDLDLNLSGTVPEVIDHNILCYIQHHKEPLILHIKANITVSKVVKNERKKTYLLQTTVNHFQNFDLEVVKTLL